MDKMFKGVGAFIFSAEQRGSWLWILFLLALFTQVPFGELFIPRSHFPFFGMEASLPRIGLHIFHTSIVCGILLLLYKRCCSFFSPSFLGERKEGWLFFALVFAYWLYWIPLGFDVTDEGRRLAHSWFIYEGMWSKHLDLRMGGHLLKGLWLHLLPGPSVLWARIGYALIKGAMGLFAFLILRRAFPNRRFEAFCFTFLGVMAISIYGGQVINYNNLPVTLTLASIYLFHIAGGGDRTDRSRKAAFFGGFLLPWAVLARFPFIVLLIVPFAWHLFIRICFRSQEKRILPSTGWTGIGILSGIGLVLLLLSGTGSLEQYGSTVDHKLIEGFLYEADESLKSHGHDKASILETYGSDAWKVGAVLLRLVPLFLLMGFLGLISGRWRSVILPLLVLIAYELLGPIIWLKDWSHGMVALPLGLFLFHGMGQRTSMPAPFVLYWGTILFFFSFLGSNNGVINILITGGGLLFMAYMLMLLREGVPSRSKWGLDPAPVLGVCILFIPFYVMHKKPHEIYRDAEQKELTRMMGSSALFGIFSTPSRVEKVDGIMRAAQKHITPYEDDLLVVNTAPIFYYLTESPYEFVKHWEMRGKTDRERKKALNGPQAPDRIIVLHKDPRIWKWPDVDRPCVDRDLPFYRFYIEYLKGTRYKELFDNGCFSLHRKVENEGS